MAIRTFVTIIIIVCYSGEYLFTVFTKIMNHWQLITPKITDITVITAITEQSLTHLRTPYYYDYYYF